jgi:hypothetical protein
MDFGYLVCRVASFYSMGYKGVMGMPIRAFWLFNRSIDRIEASQQKSQITAFAAAQSGENGKEYVDGLDQTIGDIFVVDEVEAPMKEEEQLAAFAELKKALG